MSIKPTHRLFGTNAAKKGTTHQVPEAVSAAFAHLVHAKVELETFSNEHHAIVEQLDRLRSAVEDATTTAKALYAQHKEIVGPSYGGFMVSKRRNIDASLLIELMPEALNFVKYTLPVASFDKLVADGTIPEPVAEQVDSYTECISVSRK